MRARLTISIGCWLAVAAAGQEFVWTLPAGFPGPQVPAGNPMTAVKVALGRYLFYDTRLSGNGTQACASCHKQELAFTDGKAQAVGSTGAVHPRSSMSLVNVAYAPLLTWANPELDSLEEQALVPMLGETPVELGLKGHEQDMLARLRKERVYQNLFPKAFAEEGDPFTLAHVTKALAAFERSIVSMRSSYDRYRWGGETNAISAAAKRGEIVFSSGEKGACFQCHGGWNFSAVRVAGGKVGPEERVRFFNTGVSSYEAPNRGLFESTHAAGDIGKFRPPTLRNVAVTGPYMHDGSIATLDEVIEHYAAGGRMAHVNKSPILRRLPLTAQDKADLVEFLRSLTDKELLHDPRWSNPWPQGRH